MLAGQTEGKKASIHWLKIIKWKFSLVNVDALSPAGRAEWKIVSSRARQRFQINLSLQGDDNDGQPTEAERKRASSQIGSNWNRLAGRWEREGEV